LALPFRASNHIDASLSLVLGSAHAQTSLRSLRKLDCGARVSKDGHKRDRASGHPLRDGASRLLRMRSVGLSTIRQIRFVSWNGSTSEWTACSDYRRTRLASGDEGASDQRSMIKSSQHWLSYTTEAQMIRKAKAVWRGTGRAGTGHLSTDSGVLAETPYSFKTRFENEKGTNPEELIAAAHAGCFTMALAFGLQAGGYTPTELATEAAVTLEPEGQGFRISRSALTLRAQVPNLDEATFARMAGDAEKNCPVSKVLNAAITLDAKLI